MGKKKIITKTEEVTEGVQKTAPVKASKKAKRQVLNGIANISVSYNNTRIAIADTKGEIIAWSTAGSLGFRGAKKSTPYAANLVARTCIEKAKKYNLSSIKIVVKGIGPGRESAIRGLAGSGLTVTAVMDKTPIAHNGVRSKKPRRV